MGMCLNVGPKFVWKQSLNVTDEEIPEEIEGDEQSNPESDVEYSDDFELSDGAESDVEDNDQVNGGLVREREANPSLPETVTYLETSWGSKVYVVGTAHFSEESQDDVSKVISNNMILEMCP